MQMAPETSFYSVSIYHEDVDLYGMVYHSNYLKYMERARTEWLTSQGVDMQQAWQQGVGFVVASAELKYCMPARLHDELQISTRLAEVSRVTWVFEQRITREPNTVICRAIIKVACVDAGYRPRRIPKEILSGD